MQGPFIRAPKISVLEPSMDAFLLPLRTDVVESHDVDMLGLVLYPTGRRKGEFQRIGTFTLENEEE